MDRLLTTVLSSAMTMLTLWLVQRTTAPAEERTAIQELVVDRLIVRDTLIVSDTGRPWEDGFETHAIARGLVARAGGNGKSGLWVRGRLIKTEIDDPFDDRFHAIERDGSIRHNPGHISWNVWLGDNWRQVAIIQGETLEDGELRGAAWTAGNHPGRLRFQSFRPNHDEPMTDAIIGQGMMSLGGGGYGGEGLPPPSNVLHLWGGAMTATPLQAPPMPQVVEDDGSGRHAYALIAVGPQGQRSATSAGATAGGKATLSWDSVDGADTYIVVRDGKETGHMRIEGRKKTWRDPDRR